YAIITGSNFIIRRLIIMVTSLEGKTAIVTGASSGIGQAIAKELTEAGANVVLAARNLAKLETTVAEISKKNKIRCEQTTVTTKADIDSLTEQAREAFGSIDILVNNAGKMGSR